MKGHAFFKGEIITKYRKYITQVLNFPLQAEDIE